MPLYLYTYDNLPSICTHTYIHTPIYSLLFVMHITICPCSGAVPAPQQQPDSLASALLLIPRPRAPPVPPVHPHTSASNIFTSPRAGCRCAEPRLSPPPLPLSPAPSLFIHQQQPPLPPPSPPTPPPPRPLPPLHTLCSLNSRVAHYSFSLALHLSQGPAARCPPSTPPTCTPLSLGPSTSYLLSSDPRSPTPDTNPTTPPPPILPQASRPPFSTL